MQYTCIGIILRRKDATILIQSTVLPNEEYLSFCLCLDVSLDDVVQGNLFIVVHH